MKISLNIDFDSDNAKDIEQLKSIVESIYSQIDYINLRAPKTAYSEAWNQCSWEIVAFAVTVLNIRDGESEGAVYAWFDSLCNEANQTICGPLTERAISSRVGRTSVISRSLGDFRLMRVAIRRKDGQKRVYVESKAREELLRKLNSDWGAEFKVYLEENGLEIPDFSQL